VKAKSPFCAAVKPGKQLKISVDELTSELIFEEVDCPAGKFTSGESSVCAHCAPGEIQSLAGRSACDECSKLDEYIRLVYVGNESSEAIADFNGQSATGVLQPDNQTCMKCPDVGVTCDGDAYHYQGGVWHDPDIVNPDKKTNIYACITNGCPDEGETKMKCKPGFKPDAPLCAVCEEGFYMGVGDCIGCEKPKFALFVLTVVSGSKCSS
jgi:hypothetical protein